MNNDNDKKQYIKNRYLDQKGDNVARLFTGFHFQKGRRITRPFSSFFPIPESIQKNSVNQ